MAKFPGAKYYASPRLYGTEPNVGESAVEQNPTIPHHLERCICWRSIGPTDLVDGHVIAGGTEDIAGTSRPDLRDKLAIGTRV